MFRVCSGYVQGLFRVCSGYVHRYWLGEPHGNANYMGQGQDSSHDGLKFKKANVCAAKTRAQLEARCCLLREGITRQNSHKSFVCLKLSCAFLNIDWQSTYSFIVEVLSLIRWMAILLFHSHEICKFSDKLLVCRFSIKVFRREWAIKIKIEWNIYCITLYSAILA